jgi:hypothetical protein
MEKFSHNKETESFAKAYLKRNIGNECLLIVNIKAAV